MSVNVPYKCLHQIFRIAFCFREDSMVSCGFQDSLDTCLFAGTHDPPNVSVGEAVSCDFGEAVSRCRTCGLNTAAMRAF